MKYKAIGLMSGSSLDGLDIAYVELQQKAIQWQYKILKSDCFPYHPEWTKKLTDAIYLSAQDYLLLNAEYGNYLGEIVNQFIEKNQLKGEVQLIASHGHTTFHLPQKNMTHQLGDGAALTARTGISVVSDLRSMDVALGGQGAPIVPLGEKLLFPDYHFFLNLGGIANVSIHQNDTIIAFDICAANRVLNMLANKIELPYDKGGEIASSGKIHYELLSALNSLDYYIQNFPKSLANSFGVEIIFPLIEQYNLRIEDALRTYTEHISIQIKKSLFPFSKNEFQNLMITGGGAFNSFLIDCLSSSLKEINFTIFLPEEEVIFYKEALIMALLGVLRLEGKNTVLSSVTGASKDSIGGALWLSND
jgi:anhydro-N-acetylmuramic acid kinase